MQTKTRLPKTFGPRVPDHWRLLARIRGSPP